MAIDQRGYDIYDGDDVYDISVNEYGYVISSPWDEDEKVLVSFDCGEYFVDPWKLRVIL